MTRRHYIDNAPTTTLTGSINASTTTVVVAALSGYPTSFPYPATMGMGTASAEQILVSAAVGTTLTVVRNSNGLGAFSHPAGENFNHTANAVEYDEANAHVNASTGVHGITGAVVGTTDTQTLTNKIIVNATFAASGGTAGATFTQAATTDNGWVAKNPGGTVVTKIDGNGLLTTTALTTTANVTVGGAMNATGAVTGASATITGTVSGASVTSSADVTGSTLRATSTTTETLASTGHGFQIGASGASNLAMDTNKIQARNNGSGSSLTLNALGGDVTIGNSSSTVTVAGNPTMSGTVTLSGTTNATGTLKVTNLLKDASANPLYQRGTVNLSTTGAETNHITAVVFPVAFTNAPIVVTCWASGSGTTGRWGCRPLNTTTTGFDMFFFASDSNGGNASTITSQPANWIAIGT